MYVKLSEDEIASIVKDYLFEDETIRNSEGFFLKLKIEYHKGTYDIDSYHSLNAGYVYLERNNVFGKEIINHKVNAWVNSVCWTKDGKYALSANQNATVTVIELETKKIETIRFKHSPLNIIVPSPNQNGFVGVGLDRNIYHYDLTGKSIGLITKNDGNSSNKSNQGNTNSGISMMRSSGIAEALKKFENAGIKKKESITINTMINTNLHSTLITSISFLT